MTDSTSSAGTGSRLRRVAALASALLLTVAWLLFVAPSARAACPITDPVCLVGEVVDGATDDVQDVVDDVTEVTDPIVDDVEEVVDPIVDEVEEVLPIVEVVEDVVDDVIEEVEDIIGVDVDPPIIGGEPGPGGDGGPAPTEPTGPGNPRAPGEPEPPGQPGASDDGGSGGSKTDGAIAGVPGAGAILTSAADAGGTVIETESASARIAIRAPAFFDRIGGIAGIATVLAFPLVLALVVGSFVLVQNRIDRSDPRLALAPVRPDDLRFE